MWLKDNKKEELESCFFLLLGCLMLAGCQKEIKSEDQHADVFDSTQITVSDWTGNTETIDVDLEGNSDENLTTIRNSIQDQIMSGDFSCLTNESWESKQEVYRNLEKFSAQGLEWCQLDLNGDGIEDLILQEAETVTSDSEEKRIIGIFDCKRNEARCVLWDVNDSTEYYFCGITGELMHYYCSFGTMVDVEGYEHYYYDYEWNKVIDYRLLIWYVNSPDGYDYPTKWFEAHPDMQEEGIYYRRYEGAYTGEDVEGEALTMEELKEIYRTEMGMEINFQRNIELYNSH